MLKVKKIRKGNQVDAIRRHVANKAGGDDLSVEVGHFQEQGLHSGSGYSYPQMMKIHHYGIDPLTGNTFAATRRVLSILRRQDASFKRKPEVKKALSEWSKSKPSKANNERLLSTLGKILINMEKHIIGNPNILPVTNNPTPLQLTGELKSKVAMRTSTSGSVKT